MVVYNCFVGNIVSGYFAQNLRVVNFEINVSGQNHTEDIAVHFVQVCINLYLKRSAVFLFFKAC